MKLLILIYFIYYFSYILSQNTKPRAWNGEEWSDLHGLPHYPKNPHPYWPLTDSYLKNDTSIFVAIAAYRDLRCGRTLKNLFTKAKNPERIFIGLVEQNDKNIDPDCVKSYCELMKATPDMIDSIGNLKIQPKFTNDEEEKKLFENCPYYKQIHIHRVSHLESRGPTYGRHLQSYHLKDQYEFCMQTDSHMDALPNWDVDLLKMWGLTENEYSVLSTYVQQFEFYGKKINKRWEIPHLCRLYFTGQKMPRNHQAKAAVWLTRPKLNTLWGAGFSFSKCHAERLTPYDPHLPQIFDGEEFTKALRLWTWGYDMYTPHRNIIYHDYNRPKGAPAALGWPKDQYEKKTSFERIKTLLENFDADLSDEAKKKIGKYGLGPRRTLDQYIEWSGIDTRKRKINRFTCGDLGWIPWKKDDIAYQIEYNEIKNRNGKLISDDVNFDDLKKKFDNNNNNNNNEKNYLNIHQNYIPLNNMYNIIDDDDHIIHNQDNIIDNKNLKNEYKMKILNNNNNNNNNNKIFNYIESIIHNIFGDEWDDKSILLKKVIIILIPLYIIIILYGIKNIIQFIYNKIIKYLKFINNNNIIKTK